MTPLTYESGKGTVSDLENSTNVVQNILCLFRVSDTRSSVGRSDDEAPDWRGSPQPRANACIVEMLQATVHEAATRATWFE